MKKTLKAVIVLVTLFAVLLTLTACGKSRIIGTWYYEDDPDRTMKIYENNEIKDSARHRPTYEYDYTYKGNILTLYSYGFKEHSYVVKVRGDKMYLTSGENTDVLYNSYEKACKANGIDYEAEKEIEEMIIHPAMELVDWDAMVNSMPYAGDAEQYLLSEGYDNYFYVGKEEDLEGEKYGYRNVRFEFTIHFLGEIDMNAFVIYAYENGEWNFECFRATVLDLTKKKEYGISRKKVQNLLFSENITKIDVLKGFINRNINDTSYASRVVLNTMQN